MIQLFELRPLSSNNISLGISVLFGKREDTWRVLPWLPSPLKTFYNHKNYKPCTLIRMYFHISYKVALTTLWDTTVLNIDWMGSCKDTHSSTYWNLARRTAVYSALKFRSFADPCLQSKKKKIGLINGRFNKTLYVYFRTPCTRRVKEFWNSLRTLYDYYQSFITNNIVPFSWTFLFTKILTV